MRLRVLNGFVALPAAEFVDRTRAWKEDVK